jgi:plastocyanin
MRKLNVEASAAQGRPPTEWVMIGFLLIVSVGVAFTAGLSQSLKNSVVASSHVSTSTTPAVPPGSTVTVMIQAGAGSNSSLGFFPPTITLVLGVNSSIKWVNNDYTIHTSTSNTGVWDSGNINPGASYTFIFPAAGTYAYHCNYHVWMKGTVIVLPKGSATVSKSSSSTA